MAEGGEAPKTVQDFMNREDEDESVRKWKESLLGDSAKGDQAEANPADDPRRVIPLELQVVTEGGPLYKYDLTNQAQLDDLKKKGYGLKEGGSFHYVVTFKVHHEIILGIKLKTISKKTIAKQEAEFDLGSYPPTVAPIVKECEECEVPEGMMARGEYKVTNIIADEMGREYLKFDAKMKIGKTW